MPVAARLQTDLVAKDVSLSQTLRRADKSLKRFDSGLTKLGKSLRNMVSVLGLSAGAAGIGLFIKNQIDAADRAIKFARSLDLTVEEMSSYQFAADRAGVASKQLELGIRKLATGFGDLSAGLNTEQTKAIALIFGEGGGADSSLSQRFETTLDLLSQIEDKTIAASIAADLFGERAGQAFLQLAPELRALVAEAERTGRIVDEEFATAAENLNDAMTDFGADLASASRDFLASGILQFLTDAIQLANKLANFTTQTDSGIAGFLNAISSDAQPGETGLAKWIKDATQLDEAIAELGEKVRRSPVSIFFGAGNIGGGPSTTPDAPTDTAADKLLAAFEARLAAQQELAEKRQQELESAKRLVDAEKQASQTRQLQLDYQRELVAKAQIFEDLVNSTLSAEEQRLKAHRDMVGEMRVLGDLLGRQEEAEKAIAAAQAKFREESGETFRELEALADQAARNMQDALADFFFDPFQDGLDGMLKSFIDTIRKMLAQSLALQVFQQTGLGSIFGGLLGSASRSFTINNTVNAPAGTGVNAAVASSTGALVEILQDGRPG